MKILCFTPLPYGNGAGWWGRDLALTVLGFRDLGHDAFLVCYRSTHSKDPEGRPVFLISPDEAASPSWWKNQRPDLVILGLWTRPKYDAIRRAALSATPRVIERADSDGMRTASCDMRIYARRRYDYFRDRTYFWPSFFSVPVSIMYSLASILATPWIQARLAKTLMKLPALTVETPIGMTRWKSLATKLGLNSDRIHCVPHPIQTNFFKVDSTVIKENRIISVGRWDSYQKNLPLLLKALVSFLSQNPDWSSLVVGSGLPRRSPHPRIILSAPLSSFALAQKMQGSKIFLSSSRYESFGIAAAEALCCGCVPVSLTGTESFFFFRSFLPETLQEISFCPNRGGSATLANICWSSLTNTHAEAFFCPKSVASAFLKISHNL